MLTAMLILTLSALIRTALTAVIVYVLSRTTEP